MNLAHCLDALLETSPEDICITPEWIGDIHRCIAGDLFPGWAGRFRFADVQVGTHLPPHGHEVAAHIKIFCLDLEERLHHLHGPETIAAFLAWVDTGDSNGYTPSRISMVGWDVSCSSI